MERVDRVTRLRARILASQREMQSIQQAAEGDLSGDEQDPGGSDTGADGSAPSLPPMSAGEVHNSALEGRFLGHLLGLWAGPTYRSLVQDEDYPYAATVLGSLVGFESRTLFKDGLLTVPCDIPTASKWTTRRRRAAVVDDPEKLEEYYGDRVCTMWYNVRLMPAKDVADMHGEGGLSLIVRCVLQWRIAEPKARDWTTIVIDVAAALDLLRDSVGFGDESLADVLAQKNASRAAEAAKRLLKRHDACSRRRAAVETQREAIRVAQRRKRDQKVKLEVAV